MTKIALNLTVNLGLLLGGFLMVFSGLLIQVEYHIGSQGYIDTNKMVFGLDYSTWSDIHIFSAIFVSIFMVFHFLKHWKWYKAIINKKLFAKNKQELILTLVFIMVAITGLIPLIIKLSNGDEAIRKTFIEIHDKITLILFVYLVLHVGKRLKWYYINLMK
jgi:hypothetical protein